MDGLLHSTFERYGLFVARHAKALVVWPIVLCILLSTGLVNFQQQLDVDVLYIPKGAPSTAEAQQVRRFWNLEDDQHSQLVQLLFEKGGVNLLTNGTLSEILTIHDYVVNNLTYSVKGDDGQDAQSFWDTLCNPQQQCRYANAALSLFLRNMVDKGATGPNPNVRFRYPFVESLDVRLFLGNNLLGVNDTIPEVKMITLNYPIMVNSSRMSAQVDAFERSLRRYVSAQLANGYLPCVLFSRNFMADETMKSAITLLPAIGFLLFFMLTFTITSNVSISDVRVDKRWEGAAGCLCSVMAIVSSVGLLQYFGVPMNGTIVAVPFLAMAIGIDDTFLTIQAWRLTSVHQSAEQRLSLTIRQSGVAITLTSMTDIGLFSIGLLSEMPAIQVFSLYTAVAMTFDYLYQMTFFVAVVYLLGKSEADKRCCLWHCGCAKVSPRLGSLKLPLQTLFDAYMSYICKPAFQSLLGLIYVLYLIIAFKGCSQIRVDFSASKLVVRSSPAFHFSQLMDNYYLRTAEVQVYIRNPVNFLNDTQVRRFLEFVDILESTPYSAGPVTTNLWYHSYANYLQLIHADRHEFYDHFDKFFSMDHFKQHLAEIRWRNASNYALGIGSFYFTTTFRTKHGGDSWVHAVNLWRRLADSFPEFQPIIYGDRRSVIADQLTSLAPNTLQTIGAGILSLMVMTAVFVPSLKGILLVGAVLLSTDLGVIGLLALWDVDLDPISMINILMSLDLSIEYATHVCHFYLNDAGPDAVSRLRGSLNAVGWPVIQGAIATFLGVLPLTFVDYYISMTFFKTCFLVVVTGLFHAFVVLPMAIIHLDSSADFSKEQGLLYDCVYDDIYGNDESDGNFLQPLFHGCSMRSFAHTETLIPYLKGLSTDLDLQVLVLIIFSLLCTLLLAWKKQDTPTRWTLVGFQALSSMAAFSCTWAAAMFALAEMRAERRMPPSPQRLQHSLGYSFWLLVFGDGLLLVRFALQVVYTCQQREALFSKQLST